MNSPAHKASASSILDPAYSSDSFCPEIPPPKSAFPWICGESEYVCFRLSELRKNVVTAKLRVGYPGEFREPARKGFFRTAFSGGTAAITVCGNAMFSLNGKPVPTTATANGVHTFTAEKGELLLEVSADDLPAIRPQWAGNWEYSEDGVHFIGVETFPDEGDEIPPHRKELPTVDVIPERLANGLYDAGRELLAYVEIQTDCDIVFFAGETQAEAENEDPAFFEQTNELIQLAPGLKRSKVPMAFRYLKIKGTDNAKIVCKALFTPEIYRGAFACPDKELNDIWMRSAYTLRICIHHFLIDGVKRDRLPWCGDLRISLLASAFTFADSKVVRNTLQVLGRAGIRNTHINGITDYSLWYIINHDTYQLYYADHDFLKKEYPKILDAMEVLHSQEDENSFLLAGKWNFIDWVKIEKFSALQMMYYWALKSAASLAKRMNDPAHETEWNTRAESLKKQIRNHFLDSASGLFFGDSESKKFYRHANFLAVLAGVAKPEEYGRITDALLGSELPPVGTPYMAAMEVLALAHCGLVTEGLERLRALWGGMLHDGATTFYEAYNPAHNDQERYMFYSRKFGLSLCHAWGAGPASILPELLFGIRPLEDGWKKFTASPCPMFKQMDLTVPTPHGEIRLAYTDGKLNVDAPAGTTFQA